VKATAEIRVQLQSHMTKTVRRGGISGFEFLQARRFVSLRPPMTRATTRSALRMCDGCRDLTAAPVFVIVSDGGNGSRTEWHMHVFEEISDEKRNITAHVLRVNISPKKR
jgi:hypothetical protein